MSLAKLPDCLIAKISDFLSYHQKKTMMEVNYKISASLRYYRKFRIAAETLEISVNEGKLNILCTEYGTEERFSFKDVYSLDELYTAVDNSLCECLSVGYLIIKGVDVHADVLQRLATIRFHTKITHISFVDSTVDCSGKEFIDFCWARKGYGLSFESLKDSLWTDEVVSSSLANMSFERNCPKKPEYEVFCKISDQTLDALGKTNPIQKKFSISLIHNEFTIFGVKRAVATIHNSGVTGIAWDLGILPHLQGYRAEDMARSAALHLLEGVEIITVFNIGQFLHYKISILPIGFIVDNENFNDYNFRSRITFLIPL